MLIIEYLTPSDSNSPPVSLRVYVPSGKYLMICAESSADVHSIPFWLPSLPFNTVGAIAAFSMTFAQSIVTPSANSFTVNCNVAPATSTLPVISHLLISTSDALSLTTSSASLTDISSLSVGCSVVILPSLTANKKSVIT